jgi:predicted RNA binding protein YcfA (HicA-like mRNA interferase family)
MKKDKLIDKFLETPPRKDLTFDEPEKLFKILGYEKKEGRGSRIRFLNHETGDVFITHKPHPGNILKTYVVKEVVEKIRGITDE